MSIVIPAGHLARTVITVRCDSPHAAPHIECALDEQTPFGNAPRELPRSPRAFSSDRRPTPSSSTAPPSPSGSSNVPQTDLSVERGMDHRGHFVRLSFLPGHHASHGYGQRTFEHETTDASYFTLSNAMSGTTPNMGSSQEVSSFRSTATSSPQSMGGSPLAYSSLPIMNHMSAAPAEASPTCLENMSFMCPSDAELMTALDSFMGIFDPQNTDYPMLDVVVPGNVPSSQQLSQISEPASPEMSSSSSSSSCSNSPTTPYDFFLPAATPTADGGCRNGTGGTVGLNHDQSVSESSLLSSPELPQVVPGPDPRAGATSKSGDSRLLPCPQPGCKRQFKSTSTLGGHMKTHAGKGARFPCSFPPCTEKFSRRHDQLRHEVYKHGKRCEWVCARCNSFFSYERSLEKHTCTMDKSRRGSIPYPVSGVSGSGGASGTGR